MSRARQVANFDQALFAADEVSGDKVSGGTIGAGVVGASVTGGAGLSGMTSLGTVATGTWEGTDVAVAHGGTGASTHTANNVLIGAGTSAITSIAPGADGQVLTSTGTVWQSEAAGGGTNASDLASGTLATARMAAGTVIQTLAYTYSNQEPVSGWQTTGLTGVVITPSDANNKILLTWTFILGITNNTSVTPGNFGGGFRIRRTAPDTATVYAASTQSTYFYLQSYTSGNMQSAGQYGGSVLDDPQTTSQVTYTPEATNAVSGTANANYGNSTHCIVLQEIQV